jgi:hypothetical protein
MPFIENKILWPLIGGLSAGVIVGSVLEKLKMDEDAAIDTTLLVTLIGVIATYFYINRGLSK